MKNLDEIIALGEVDMLLDVVKKHTEERVGQINFAGVEKEDVVQEVLIKVYQNLNKFDKTKASARTFFSRVIDNKIRDCLRLSGTNTNLALVNAYSLIDDYQDIDTEETTNEIAVGTEDIGYSYVEFRSIVSEFSDIEKRVLKLKMSGYTLQEIADKLGYSKSRIGQISREISKRFI